MLSSPMPRRPARKLSSKGVPRARPLAAACLAFPLGWREGVGVPCVAVLTRGVGGEDHVDKKDVDENVREEVKKSYVPLPSGETGGSAFVCEESVSTHVPLGGGSESWPSESSSSATSSTGACVELLAEDESLSEEHVGVEKKDNIMWNPSRVGALGKEDVVGETDNTDLTERRRSYKNLSLANPTTSSNCVRHIPSLVVFSLSATYLGAFFYNFEYFSYMVLVLAFYLFAWGTQLAVLSCIGICTKNFFDFSLLSPSGPRAMRVQSLYYHVGEKTNTQHRGNLTHRKEF